MSTARAGQRIPEDVISAEELPYLHENITLDDIQANTKLLSAEEIIGLQIDCADKEDGRYHKNDLASVYGIIKLENRYYAVYHGVKHHKELGVGGQGKVKLVQDLYSGEWLALKINRSKESNAIYNFEREHAVLSRLGIAVGPIFFRDDANNQSQHFMMHLARGKELQQLKEFLDTLPAIALLDLILQILKITADLHQQDIIHGDIKTENYLLDPVTMQVTATDFGMAVVKDNNGNYSATPRGTMICMSPELADAYDDYVQEFHYGKPVDIYALGELLRELFAVRFSMNREINLFMKAMISADIERRPIIETCLKFFEEQRKLLLPISQSNVAIVNVIEFLKSPTVYLPALECLDEVYFICPKTIPTPANILEARRILEKNNIHLKDKILRVRSDSFHLIPAYLAAEGINNEYFFLYHDWSLNRTYWKNSGSSDDFLSLIRVSPEYDGTDYENVIQHAKRQVTTGQLDEIVFELYREMQRLIDRFHLKQSSDENPHQGISFNKNDNGIIKEKRQSRASSRADLINEAISDLQTQQENLLLSYRLLYRRLEDLRVSVIPNSIFNNKKSETGKVIEDLESKVHILRQSKRV